MYGLVILTAVLTAILALAGALLAGAPGALLASLISLIIMFTLWLKSDSLILGIYKAEPSNDYKLTEMLKYVAREAQIPLPRLYVIKTTHFMPNAISLGRDRAHSSIAVTGGLLSLKDDEIMAVLAHEAALIRNRVNPVRVTAAALALIIAYPAQIGYWHLFHEGGDLRSGSHVTGFILMALFGYPASFLVRLSVAGSDVYRADYVSALLTKSPRALTRALEKIQDAISQKPLQAHAATSHLWLVSPFYRDRFNRLFNTTPPTDGRMRKLLEMEGRALE
jgi:heat shock protein HtpX